MATWVSWQQYHDFCRQAAENDGRVIIEARGSDPIEIRMDVELAKKECAEFDRIIDKFNQIGN